MKIRDLWQKITGKHSRASQDSSKQRDQVQELEARIEELSRQVAALNAGQDSNRIDEIDQRLSQLSQRVEQLETREPSSHTTEKKRDWGGKNRLDVPTTVELINELGGFTDANELLQKAQKEIDPKIVHQTVSKCIIDGRKQGVLDYDKNADPTRIWTPGNKESGEQVDVNRNHKSLNQGVSNEKGREDYKDPILVSLYEMGENQYWTPEQIQDNWKGKYIELNEDDLAKEKAGKGTRTVYKNRHAWALVELQQDNLIQKNGNRKEYQITDKGVKRLKERGFLK